MKYKEIIAQLKSLKENSRSFLEDGEQDSIWHQDIKALNAAIGIVREHPALAKKLKRLESRLKSHGSKKPRCRKRKPLLI